VGELRELQEKRVCAYLFSLVGELRRTGNSRAAALTWRALLRSVPQVLRLALFLRLPLGAAASSAALGWGAKQLLEERRAVAGDGSAGALPASLVWVLGLRVPEEGCMTF